MYSAQSAGILKEVIVHHPGTELDIITPLNMRDYLFDGLIYKDEAQVEHQEFVTALQQAGVKVNYLTDLARSDPILTAIVQKLPNMLFIRDLAVITSDGAIISNMRYPIRGVEPEVIKVILKELGIKILCEIEPPASLEGGDVLFLDRDTMLVGQSERTNEDGVGQLKDAWLTEERRTLVKIPIKPVRASMHLDSVIGVVSKNCVGIHNQSIAGQVTMYQMGSLEPMPMEHFLRARQVKQIEVTSTEQFNMACNALMIEPNKKLICYRRSFKHSLGDLEKQGVGLVKLDLPQLFLGAGGPHCMTLELNRGRKET